jgi:phage I-like protein
MTTIGPFRSVPLFITLDEAEGISSAPSWVQLFRTGVYHDDRYGEFEITTKNLAEMKSNFEANIRGIDLAIDYKHESEDIAAGWIKALEIKNNGTELWAEVDWTPNGKRVLGDKEFRYISPDFTYEYKDNESLKKFGPTLFGAGLTNRPVIKRMAPAVELNEGKGNCEMDEKDKLIAELQAKVAELEKLKGDHDSQMGELKKQLEEYKAAGVKAEEAKALAEKNSKFDKWMTEGRVVEAQREAFMSGDSEKFAELAQPVKLSENGSNKLPNKEGQPASKEEAEKKLSELGDKVLSEKRATTIGEAIRLARKEHPELVALCN